MSMWCIRIVQPLSSLSTCVRSRAHLNISPIFNVKFCITLEISRILRWNLAEMWNNYIQINWAKKKKNHVAQRANSILQKPSPHSGMHWLRFSIWACIDSGPRIWSYIDLHCEQVHFVLLFFLQMISRHCVIKWRHSVKILTDLESAHQGYYTIWFLRFQNLTLRYTVFDPVLAMKVMGDRL
jgi:hypothetical protein